MSFILMLGTILLQPNSNIKLENNNLTESFEKEIFNNSFELSTDIAQLSLEMIFEKDFLKEIPIMKTLVSFYNITNSIIARHNVKKIIVFLQEFHSNKIENGKLDKFKAKFNSEQKYKEEVLETILVLIEKFVIIKKSKILANLFKSHIEEKINWEEFQNLSFVLNNLNPAAYTFLINYIEKNKPIKMIDHMEGEALLMACGVGSKFEDRFQLHRTGRQLYDFGLKPSNR